MSVNTGKKDNFRAGIKQIAMAVISGERRNENFDCAQKSKGPWTGEKETGFGIQGYPELQSCCLLLEQ